MILDIGEVKGYLRIDDDYTEEDINLNLMIGAAEQYLKNATGKEFDENNKLAKLVCLILITDWYENRDMIGKASEKVRYSIQSCLIQLQLCG